MGGPPCNLTSRTDYESGCPILTAFCAVWVGGDAAGVTLPAILPQMHPGVDGNGWVGDGWVRSVLSQVPKGEGPGAPDVLFSIDAGRMVLLHGFQKKTQKTPAADLELARKRMREVTE